MNLFVRITTRRRRTRAKAARRPPVRLNLDILEDRSLPSVAVAPVFTPEIRVPVPYSSYYSRPDIGVAGAGAYAGTFDVVYLTSAGNATTIEVTRFNADGTPLAAALGLNDITVDANNSTNSLQPRIAVRADGSFVVVYRQSSGAPNLETIAAKIYNADGSLRTAIPNVVATGYQTSDMIQPAVAIQDATGNVSITWVRVVQSGIPFDIAQSEVWWRRLDANGNFLSARDQKVNGGSNSSTPAVRMVPSPLGPNVVDTVITYDDGGVFGAGKDIHFARFDNAGNQLDAASVQANVTTDKDYVSFSRVALDAAGEFVIVWEDRRAGVGQFHTDVQPAAIVAPESTRAMMRRYDKNGNNQSPANMPEVISISPGTNQDHPGVARANDGRFLVSFQENTVDSNGFPSNYRDVFIQYNKDGVPIGKMRDFSSTGVALGELIIAASANGVFGIVTGGSYTFARTFREQPPEFFGVATGPNQLTLYRAANGMAFGTFAPFSAYNGGLALAWGDVNGDGIPDLVVTATSGNPAIKVYDGQAIRNNLDFFTNPDSHLLGSGFVHLLGLNIGINVAVGDIEGNGFADIVTAPTAGNPHIQIFSGKRIADDIQNGFGPHRFSDTGHVGGPYGYDYGDSARIASGFAYALNLNLGANLAVADMDGDGYADIITAPTIGNPHIKVFSGKQILGIGVVYPAHVIAGMAPFGPGRFGPNDALLASFFAYATNLNIGAFVAAGDVDGDGIPDIITGASSGNPEVRIYRGADIRTGRFNNANPEASSLDHFFAFETGRNFGVTVGAAVLSGDSRAAILTGSVNRTPFGFRVFKTNPDNTHTQPPDGFPPNPPDLPPLVQPSLPNEQELSQSLHSLSAGGH